MLKMQRFLKLRNKLLRLTSRKRQLIAVFTGVILAVAGIINYVDWFKTTELPDAPIQSVLSQTVSVTTGEPDETPIIEANYEVPPDMPRQIILQTIDAKGYIQRVGRDQHNAIAAPSNLFLAGWFEKSVLPGQTGLSLIDGHSQGKYSDGIFRNIDRLQPGEMFDIEFGDRTLKHFEVVSVDTYSAEAAAEEQFKKIPSVDQQLTLVTCGGSYNRTTKQYESRVIVRSKLVL